MPIAIEVENLQKTFKGKREVRALEVLKATSAS